MTAAAAGQAVDLVRCEAHDALARIEGMIDESSHILARLRALEHGS